MLRMKIQDYYRAKYLRSIRISAYSRYGNAYSRYGNRCFTAGGSGQSCIPRQLGSRKSTKDALARAFSTSSSAANSDKPREMDNSVSSMWRARSSIFFSRKERDFS